MQESVVKTSGVSRRLARSLPEFSLFQVLLSLLAPHLQVLPLIALGPICRVIYVPGVQRVENQKPDQSLSGPADLLEVVTCPHELASARTAPL